MTDLNFDDDSSHNHHQTAVVPSKRRPTPIRIKELDLDRIFPNEDSVKTTAGGSVIVMIGKRHSGKSVLIKALLHAKRKLIPIGLVVSGTEDMNHFYEKTFPRLFVNEKYRPSIIEAVQKRQKFAKEHLPNSWAVLVLDDCMDDVKQFNEPTMLGLIKNSRHWNLLSIFANQYVFDFKPVIRTNIDGVFIFRDPNIENREKLYRNFASIVPSFKLFCQLMDELTSDHACVYIDNRTSSNDWQDCVYYYKAPLLDDFSFGCDEYWKFSDERANR